MRAFKPLCTWALLLSLLSLSACLKSNGEPYPGAKWDGPDGQQSGDYEIDLDPSDLEETVNCESSDGSRTVLATARNVADRYGVDHLYIEVKTKNSTGAYTELYDLYAVVAKPQAAGPQSYSFKSGALVTLYVRPTADNTGRYPGTLKYEDAAGETITELMICDSYGY